jgi:predicted transcriptional regulator
MQDPKQPETMLDYVKRKLNDPVYNCAEIARQTGMRKSTLSEIGSGKTPDPQFSTVEKIYAYFKSKAD